MGLTHYSLALHPRLYLNRSHDQLVLHFTFSPQVDPRMYFSAKAGFDWSAGPDRVAILLSPPGSYNKQRDYAWRRRGEWLMGRQPHQNQGDYSEGDVWNGGSGREWLER